MAKSLTFGADARLALKKGVDKINETIRFTLGPKGKSVIIDRGWGSPLITEDGASIADEIELIEGTENIGTQMIKESASKTNDTAGDGTTTCTLLAAQIFNEGLKLISAGYNPMFLTSGISKGCDRVIEELKKKASKVEGRKDILNVATIAAKNDPEIGKIIADAFEKVGKEGTVTIEEGKSTTVEMKVVEGMQFDRGFLSPYFITDEESVRCVLNEPYILIYEDKISQVTKLIPLLEKLAEKKKALIVIAEDVEGDALATLVVNKIKGILECAAVKAPGYGDRRKAMLEDIAILTGGKAIFKELGVDLEKVTFDMLGRAKKVIISSEETIITEGAGSEEEIKNRCEQIKREIKETDSDYDREKLEERLAKLMGGVAQIFVGAPTETEMKEIKHRVEDAFHSTKSAVEEGIVAGGGVALLRAISVLDEVETKNEDEKQGIEVLKKALEAPIKQIAENSGADAAVVLRTVKKNTGDFGYDAEKNEYGNLIEKGIVDPVKVVRYALKNAVSVANLLLTLECLVTEQKEDEDEKHKISDDEYHPEDYMDEEGEEDSEF